MARMHLDPKVKIYWLFPVLGFLAIIWLIGIAGVAFVDEDHIVFGMRLPTFALMSALAISAMVLLPLYFYYTLEYKAYTYEFTEQAIVVRNGILSTNEVTIPYAHISRIEAERSVLERLIGLVSVEIVTPGPKELEVNHIIPGLPAGINFSDELENWKTNAGALRAPWEQAGKSQSVDSEVLLKLVGEMHSLNENVGGLLREIRSPPRKK